MNALLAIFNIFIDPAASVGYQKAIGKWAWVLPFVIATVAIGIVGYLQTPFTVEAIRSNPSGNMSPQDAEKAAEMVEKFAGVGIVAAPIVVAILMLISSGIVLGCAKIFDLRVDFASVFSLIAHAGLVSILASVTHIVVLKLKGSVSSMHELKPSFGLDLLLAEDANKYLDAFLNYFSFYTIWYIIVLGVGFAALAQTEKRKAFLATAPVWLLGLCFALVGAIFAKR